MIGHLAASGVLLAVLGGMLNGSFTAPMKFTRKWAWENTWFIFSIALFGIPLVIALVSVPELMQVYQNAGTSAVALVILFGFGWGVGCALFGLGIQMLGMALGFAIILGLTAALGSLIPLLVLTPRALQTSRGASILAGLAIVVLGIGVCAKAGAIKNKVSSRSLVTDTSKSNFRAGLLACIGSGIFNAMLNLALAFGAPVAEAAARNGATPAATQNAIWALAVGGGAIANIAYALFLLSRNRSWREFGANRGRNLPLGITMGLLWMAGVLIYGIGAASLGSSGPVIGWPVFMSMVIITGNVWGFATGEWKDAPPAALRMSLAGVGVLILAIAVISLAGTF